MSDIALAVQSLTLLPNTSMSNDFVASIYQKPPPKGEFKVNRDATMSSSNEAARGRVLRGHWGVCYFRLFSENWCFFRSHGRALGY